MKCESCTVCRHYTMAQSTDIYSNNDDYDHDHHQFHSMVMCYNITTKDNNNYSFKRFILCTKVASRLNCFKYEMTKF